MCLGSSAAKQVPWLRSPFVVFGVNENSVFMFAGFQLTSASLRCVFSGGTRSL